MSKNSRYKIFHEYNADKKLSVLLSIQKFNPAYSELLKKVKLKADELKPILEELQKYDYIAIDINNHYMGKRPLPSVNDIKVYRYILRHSPKHSKMLRSINDIDARHITATLSKLQKDGLLHYDIKTERYSIIIKDDDVIGIIMDSIDTDEKVLGFIQKFRDNFRIYDLDSWNSQKVFLSTFFVFTTLQEHNLDLVSWLMKNGYHSLLDILEYDELYAQIVKRGKQHSYPFWQTIDKYLCVLDEQSYSFDTDSALIEDIEQMDEQYIMQTISQMPTLKDKNEFIKVLEQKLFDGYRYLLTVKTSYTGDIGRYTDRLGKELSKFYMLAYPENVLIDIYRDALGEFSDYKKYKKYEDDSAIFEQYCTIKVLDNLGMYLRRNGYDLETLVSLIYNNKRTYTGRLTKRMKDCLYHLIQQHSDDEYTKALKFILPDYGKSLS